MYDIMLNNKFLNWTKGTDVTYTGPDETRRLFEVLADKSNDQPIQLPMICLRRDLGYTINIYGKRPTSYNGFRRDISNINAKFVNMIPIVLNYQVDVYARYFQEADDYMRNIVFNIINYPKLEVEVKYLDIDFQHVANILPGQQVFDNSNISERLIPGQFTRLSYSFSIDDAYLWDVRLRNNVKIGVQNSDNTDIGDLHIIDKSTGEDIVEKLSFIENC